MFRMGVGRIKNYTGGVYSAPLQPGQFDIMKSSRKLLVFPSPAPGNHRIRLASAVNVVIPVSPSA